MDNDGLYISHGIDNHALVVIRQDSGRTLWVRDFATIGSALDILQDDVLQGQKRSEIESQLSVKRGFFTEEYGVPEDGLGGSAFQKYTLTK
jgi:hypothetical protein